MGNSFVKQAIHLRRVCHIRFGDAHRGQRRLAFRQPILCQITRPELRATGYGIMNLVSISCGGFGDWAFGALRDRHVPLNAIFGVFAGIALLSVILVLFIRPQPALSTTNSAPTKPA